MSSAWVTLGLMAVLAAMHALLQKELPAYALLLSLGAIVLLLVRLGGPASYDGVAHERPSFGEGPRPSALDLTRGLGLYLRACAALVAALAVGGLLWPR